MWITCSSILNVVDNKIIDLLFFLFVFFINLIQHYSIQIDVIYKLAQKLYKLQFSSWTTICKVSGQKENILDVNYNDCFRVKLFTFDSNISCRTATLKY